jgi:ADP-ribose pyrophosphatase
VFKDTLVQYIAYDSDGNVAVCNVNITVPDDQKPTLECPQSYVVELIEKQAAFCGYFRIDRLRLRFPLYEGGMSREVEREVLERGQVAAVLLVDPDRDCVVLIEQFRPGPYAAGEPPWLIEAVAGVIEGGESAEELARREAREEANCEITDLFPIMHFFTSPGASTESVALFCGRVDSTDAGGVHGL